MNKPLRQCSCVHLAMSNGMTLATWQLQGPRHITVRLLDMTTHTGISRGYTYSPDDVLHLKLDLGRADKEVDTFPVSEIASVEILDDLSPEAILAEVEEALAKPERMPTEAETVLQHAVGEHATAVVTFFLLHHTCQPSQRPPTPTEARIARLPRLGPPKRSTRPTRPIIEEPSGSRPPGLGESAPGDRRVEPRDPEGARIDPT